jgi:phospholipid/cholesterol/gamma-HCH transport system substrate-binding protein
MSNKNNKTQIITGLFVTIGLLILVVGIFTLGGQKKSFISSMELAAVFDNVNGLQEGNNVFFSGVKIGTVKKVSFSGSSQVRVMFHIDKKVRDFIHKDAKVKIGSEGLIGNKTIEIYGGSDTYPVVEDKDTLQVLKAQGTDDMMATLQENNKNILAITSDLKKVSGRLAAGEGTLGALLTDSTIFKSLEVTVAKLQIAVRNGERLTNGIADYAAKLQTPGSLADGLVHDTVIMSNLKEAVVQINAASAATTAFTKDLKNAGYQLSETNNPVGLLLNDQGTAADLKAFISNLNSSSEKLDDDLEALQHNFLFRGFFKRKAKEEAKAKKK